MHKTSNNNKVKEKDYNSTNEGNISPRWGEQSPTSASFISFQQMGRILIASLHSSKYWKCQQNPIVIEKWL
jgi:hypothetical protein